MKGLIPKSNRLYALNKDCLLVKVLHFSFLVTSQQDQLACHVTSSSAFSQVHTSNKIKITVFITCLLPKDTKRQEWGEFLDIRPNP